MINRRYFLGAAVQVPAAAAIALPASSMAGAQALATHDGNWRSAQWQALGRTVMVTISEAEALMLSESADRLIRADSASVTAAIAADYRSGRTVPVEGIMLSCTEAGLAVRAALGNRVSQKASRS